VSSLNPFSCKIQIFKVRVKVSYFFYETLKIFNDFSRENTAMAAMNIVSARWFSGVSFHLRRCPQGVASVLCKKTPIFGSQLSKLDHLTVCSRRVHKIGEQVKEVVAALGPVSTWIEDRLRTLGPTIL
jgi:hypothetical protein